MVIHVNAKFREVLILVLMEDGLRDKNKTMNNLELSLNPCSYGRWSQSMKTLAQMRQRHFVLILVLMEDGLRAYLCNCT